MKILFLMFLVAPLLLSAQMSKEEIIKLLTYNSSRIWTLNEYKKTLGNRCIGNWISYTFYKEGWVEMKSCVKEKIYTDQFNWDLEFLNSNSYEYQITFSKPLSYQGKVTNNVRVNFPKIVGNKKQKMVWRDVPKCKTCIGQIFELIAVK